MLARARDVMSRTLGGCSFFEPCDGLGTHIKGRGVISESSLSATKSISCSRFRRGQSRNKNTVVRFDCINYKWRSWQSFFVEDIWLMRRRRVPCTNVVEKQMISMFRLGARCSEGGRWDAAKMVVEYI